MSNIGYSISPAVRNAYRKGREDETLPPHVLIDKAGKSLGRMRHGDAVIFYNIRGEREIELTRCLTDPTFDKFPVEKNLSLHFATMIEYEKDLKVHVAFPPQGVIEDTLSETIDKNHLKQVKITESEKAIHAGYFLNGKRYDALPGEERVIIPTRKDIDFFDKAPEMSIEDVTKAIIEKIQDPSYQFIFANFPNVDVVGHIENESAVIRAIEIVDACTGQVMDEAVRGGITAIVTADHGTAEKWLYPDGAIDTGHTDSSVPFLLIHRQRDIALARGGELADIAPTILDLMGIHKPSCMTGHTLIDRDSRRSISPSQRLLLLILDGWGEQDDLKGNLIAKARTPTMDRLKKAFPYTTLRASGEAVGLPEGTVGNSEAGHLHIGAGRRIYSDRVRIDRAIADKSFFENDAFDHVMRAGKNTGGALHLLGIVSFFSSHGSISHLFALMDLAKQADIPEVFIHVMLGRRGEMPESGANYLENIERKAREIGMGKVVSVIGRYWSMDREENWDRIEKTYRMLVYGEGIPVEERG
jgi:2,3-bisphosphoglycerate-independent phosphoglycerate mutase